MIVLTTGLIRRRPVFVYAFRQPATVAVGLGVIAMVTRDLALVASPIPKAFDAQEVSIGPGDVLIRGRVRRQPCWDRSIVWPPDSAESLVELVESGRYALVIERIAEPPNIVRIYRRAISQGLVRAETILNMESAVSILPALVGVVEVQGFRGGKPFWKYPRPCLAGSYINNALARLGIRVV